MQNNVSQQTLKLTELRTTLHLIWVKCVMPPSWCWCWAGLGWAGLVCGAGANIKNSPLSLKTVRGGGGGGPRRVPPPTPSLASATSNLMMLGVLRREPHCRRLGLNRKTWDKTPAESDTALLSPLKRNENLSQPAKLSRNCELELDSPLSHFKTDLRSVPAAGGEEN